MAGFGFSIGDILTTSTFAWNLYKSCKSAGPEFQEISHEVVTLHTAIKELEDEAGNPDSILNRTGKSKKVELNRLLKNCTTVLRSLEKLVTKYKSLGTSSKRAWDRIQFGLESLQDIREKLLLHTSALNLFLTTLGTGSLGRIEKKLEEIHADVLQGRREGSVLTVIDNLHDDEADDSWNQLKAELVEDGFTKIEIESHKDWIKSRLRELIENGEWEEAAPVPILEDMSPSPRLTNPGREALTSSSGRRSLHSTVEDYKGSEDESSTFASGEGFKLGHSDEGSHPGSHSHADKIPSSSENRQEQPDLRTQSEVRANPIAELTQNSSQAGEQEQASQQGQKLYQQFLAWLEHTKQSDKLSNSTPTNDVKCSPPTKDELAENKRKLWKLESATKRALKFYNFTNDQIDAAIKAVEDPDLLEPSKEQRRARKETIEAIDLEYQLSVRLAHIGLSKDQIINFLEPERPAEFPRPTYPEVHKDRLSINTLKHYGLPWGNTPDPNFIIVLCEIDEDELRTLFEHTCRSRASHTTQTRHLREGTAPDRAGTQQRGAASAEETYRSDRRHLPLDRLKRSSRRYKQPSSSSLNVEDGATTPN